MATPSSDLGLEQQQAGAFPTDGGDDFVPGQIRLESTKEKLYRKLKEQPLVPIGTLLTCAALIAASNHLRKGNRNEFQRALRWRVGFQGLTIVGAVAGSLYYNQSVSPPPPVPQQAPATASQSQQPQQQPVQDAMASRGQTNLWQQMRADERAAKQRKGFNERLDKAKARTDLDEEKELEEALLGKEEEAPIPEPPAPVPMERTRPVIGMDRRQV